MKKRILALLTATVMAVTPISVMAEEETDYSYLEDMSVKELRALRAAINELLGDEEGTGEDNTEETEEVETTEEEKCAKTALDYVRSILTNSEKLEVESVYYVIDPKHPEHINFKFNCNMAGKSMPLYIKTENGSVPETYKLLATMYGLDSACDAIAKIYGEHSTYEKKLDVDSLY